MGDSNNYCEARLLPVTVSHSLVFIVRKLEGLRFKLKWTAKESIKKNGGTFLFLVWTKETVSISGRCWCYLSLKLTFHMRSQTRKLGNLLVVHMWPSWNKDENRCCKLPDFNVVSHPKIQCSWLAVSWRKNICIVWYTVCLYCLTNNVTRACLHLGKMKFVGLISLWKSATNWNC